MNHGTLPNADDGSKYVLVNVLAKEMKSIYIAPFIYYVYLKVLRHG